MVNICELAQHKYFKIRRFGLCRSSITAVGLEKLLIQKSNF